MAKKTARTKKMTPVTVQDEKDARPVRLDLSAADHRRLERCARERGLSKASYARMAVLELIRADEGRS
jgi:hypothetical protein